MTRNVRHSQRAHLVDVYCLGVKNALGPRIMNERDLPAFLRRFFTPFDKVSAPLAAAPLELARHLAWVRSTTLASSALSRRPISSLLPGTSGRGRRPARSRSDATASRSTSRALRQPSPSSPRPDQIGGRGQLPLHCACQGRSQLVIYNSGHDSG